MSRGGEVHAHSALVMVRKDCFGAHDTAHKLPWRMEANHAMPECGVEP